MLRSVLAAVVGMVVWGVVATVINFGIRAAIPAYHTAELTMSFDLTMMLARLADSTVALVIAAYAALRIARGAETACWILAGLMLVLFVPWHIHIWTRFPVWYHAFFLTSLLVVPLAVGRLTRSR